MTEICILGDLYLDILTSPVKKAKPETIEEGEIFTSIGGNASNAAVALSSLGVKTQLICALSSDIFGRMLERELKRKGVRLFAIHKNVPQALTLGLNFASGKRFFFGNNSKTNMLLSERDIPKKRISGRIFFSGGFWFTPMLFRGLKGIFSHTKKRGIINCMDVCWDHEGFPKRKTDALFSLLPLVDYLFLNASELKGICKKNLSLSRKIMLEAGVKNIVLHKGSAGSSLLSEKERIDASAFATEIRNPTGTGDVFNAGFMYGLLKGFSHGECLRFGNACASLHLGGKSYPSAKLVRKLL